MIKMVTWWNVFIQALDMYWHEDCLKCGCCDCRLGEVGHSLYTKGNLLLCKRDYLRWEIYICLNTFTFISIINRLFGSTGYCAACNKVIPAFEMVMRARTNVYHLECFACQQCGHRYGNWEIFVAVINRFVNISDFVWVISSIYLIIRFSVVPTTRNGCSSRTFRIILIVLLN